MAPSLAPCGAVWSPVWPRQRRAKGAWRHQFALPLRKSYLLRYFHCTGSRTHASDGQQVSSQESGSSPFQRTVFGCIFFAQISSPVPYICFMLHCSLRCELKAFVKNCRPPVWRKRWCFALKKFLDEIPFSFPSHQGHARYPWGDTERKTRTPVKGCRLSHRLIIKNIDYTVGSKKMTRMDRNKGVSFDPTCI